MSKKITVNLPKGSMPLYIRLWIAANGKEFWPHVVCKKCGNWVDEIDHHAPYYTSNNKCYKCEKEIKERVEREIRLSTSKYYHKEKE